MKKVLWFSRHEMNADQIGALSTKLGEVLVTQINGNMENIHKPFVSNVDGVETSVVFKELVKEFDVIAIVAPINLQQQILGCADTKPVIYAKNNRVLVSVEGDESKVEFVFAGWERLVKIEVITEAF